MRNASVAYEVLIYLNSFYFGMFAPCELSMGILKAINLPYSEQSLLIRDSTILVTMILVEGIRVLLGRRGSLANRDWQVIVSAILIVPCMAGVCYIAIFQERTLKLEYTMCILMAALHVTEFWYFVTCVSKSCKPMTYV